MAARKHARRLVATRPIPQAKVDEPSDDELLRYLDGHMSPKERKTFEAKLKDSPHTATRLELLAEALREFTLKS